MTQITVGNGNCKKKSLNTDMWKSERMYPTKFSTCPSYLLKQKPAERLSLGFSDARKKISAQRIDSKFLECNPVDNSLSWGNVT